MPYTSDFLRKLRNDISIDRVISDILKLEAHRADKILRFRCPLCQNRHTATSLKHNLARCFDCNVSFNPIDLVIEVKKCCFVDAAEYLKNHL